MYLFHGHKFDVPRLPLCKPKINLVLSYRYKILKYNFWSDMLILSTTITLTRRPHGYVQFAIQYTLIYLILMWNIMTTTLVWLEFGCFHGLVDWLYLELSFTVMIELLEIGSWLENIIWMCNIRLSLVCHLKFWCAMHILWIK